MRPNIKLLLVLIIAGTTHAQNEQTSSLHIGDPAPLLRVKEWIKGIPFERFEKGHVYVLEFWATWCKPCIASMPHLSALAHEYKDKVTIVGIDIHEDKNTSFGKIKAFVDSMKHRMDYHVVTQDSNFLEVDWLNASGEQGIPNTFIVNNEGKLAWIGHPKDIDDVLHRIVNNKWDIKAELDKQNLNKRLAELDKEANFELNFLVGDAIKPGDLGRPDSALLMINEIITKEPKLKYAPFIASHTFSALLKTDPDKAYKFGNEVLITSTYEDPPYNLIIGSINWYSDKLNIPAKIYELGAEIYQIKIDQYAKFGNMDIPKSYSKMADMYWRAKNRSKAIESIQKAIEALKNEKESSEVDMTTLESQLQQYKLMLHPF